MDHKTRLGVAIGPKVPGLTRPSDLPRRVEAQVRRDVGLDREIASSWDLWLSPSELIPPSSPTSMAQKLRSSRVSLHLFKLSKAAVSFG